ncbi:hypothetical protein U9M48_000591 [Paspalum notatum var. saurae]|uniref:Uncharacterized protein n=1 Tax=Paspalum notatum var. saurae TaxID=547442 RepID=A0AAQ3PEZ5_PASNO
MAEAIVGPLVGKLQELAASEAKALVAVNDDIRGLRDRLMWMQAFLRHADPRRRDTSDELMRVWLKQTRDVAFDAEDAIDEYALKVNLSRSRMQSSADTHNQSHRDCTKRSSDRRGPHAFCLHALPMAMPILALAAAKEAITRGNTMEWPKQGLAVTAVDDAQPSPIKRVDMVKKLQDAIFSGKRNRLVICVTGEGGVGKATLVRELYDMPKTKSTFQLQRWISFAPNLRSSTILQLIYSQVTKSKTWIPKDDVDKKLKEKLSSEKPFLFILDGEVSNSDWNTILAALSDDDDDHQSRIVRIMQGTHKRPHGFAIENWIELQHFAKIETNNLFSQRVFQEEKTEGQISMQNFNDDLHGITKGLPLAIVLLSGLMQTKEYPNEWQAVFDHLKANKSKRLDSILVMCFDDLPHDLKSCFLYFAALPMNTPIEARKLICMWMAEGFLRPKDGKTMEKVGRIYLQELIIRHLVIFVKTDNLSASDKFVAVHHKVHTFLQNEAQEASFVDIHNGNDIVYLATTRRLSLQNCSDKYAALGNSLPKLRSIFGHGNPQETIKLYIEEMFQVSKFLRVINLQGIEIGPNLPETIGNVAHLQYLGVTACLLKHIPSTIENLKNLQTLDVRNTYVDKLPDVFWRITTLRHVFGGGLFLPKEVGDLKHLQTLESIYSDENNCWNSKTFEKMVHLQSLHVWDDSDNSINAEAISTVIEKENLLEYLDTLILAVNKIQLSLFTSSSMRRLRTLKVYGELDRSALQSTLKESKFYFPNLNLLSLSYTKVSQDFINKLGKLPLLANLILDTESYENSDGLLVFCAGGFKSLTKLTLSDLENAVKKLKIEKSALPELIDLEVEWNPDEIKIEVCGEREFVKKIKEQDGDLYCCITQVAVGPKKIARTAS